MTATPAITQPAEEPAAVPDTSNDLAFSDPDTDTPDADELADLPVLRSLPPSAIETPEILPPEEGFLPIITLPNFEEPPQEVSAPVALAAPDTALENVAEAIPAAPAIAPSPIRAPSTTDHGLWLFFWFITWPMLWPLMAIIVIIIYLLYVQGFLDVLLQFVNNTFMGSISRLFGLKKP